MRAMSSTSPEFPEIVAAVREAEEAERKADDSLWRIGDVLVAACGPVREDHSNNGAIKKLEKIEKDLKREGFGKKYSVVYLKLLRRAASKFPHDKRLSSLPWSVHMAADDLKTLAKVLAYAKRRGHEVTVKYVKERLADWKDEAEKKDRENNSKLNNQDEANLARDDAKQAVLDIAVEVQELAQEAEDTIASYEEALSEPERTELFAEVTKAARKLTALADRLAPNPAELREAAE